MNGSLVRDKVGEGGIYDKRLYGSYIVQISSFDCHLNKFCCFFTHKIRVLHGEEVKQEHPVVTESITGSGPPSAARQGIWLLMGGGSSFLRPPEHRLCTRGNPSSCACEA